MCPTVQQGGTQTIQQSIYLSHDNPCGLNRLIFQGMGYTQIRYIDLKNYLDEILGSEEMVLLFEQVRIDGTEFMNSPLDTEKQNKYLYSLNQWAEAGLGNLPVPVDFYGGYQFSFSVFDGSGCMIYGSNSPTLKIISASGGTYNQTTTPLAQIFDVVNYIYIPNVSTTKLYKLCNDYVLLPFISDTNVINSDFIINQLSLPETIMAVSSLLVDSANTRTFGVPRYGFSNRSNQLQVAGIAYYCAHIIDIYSIPDENGETTLIESIFARIALEENGPPSIKLSLLGKNEQLALEKTTTLTMPTGEDLETTMPEPEEPEIFDSPKYNLLNFMFSMKNKKL
jgi:hypothetical protein